MPERYFIKNPLDTEEREVTLDEWIRVERGAGFHGPADRPATAGFMGINGARGRVEFVRDDQDDR